MKKYKKIALGGTFDHFHKGHQYFLLAAGELADSLLIGVTTEKLQSKKNFPELIESYDHRAGAVKAFTKNLFLNTEIVPLNNQYGPTLEGSTVEAILVTSDTEHGAHAINSKRKEIGLPELPIHITALEKDTLGGVISSARIRAGEINRMGEVYASIFDHDVTISPPQRQHFTHPQGELVQHPSAATRIYVVGDYSLSTFRKNSWQYDLGIIDHKIQRKAYDPPIISPEEIDVTVNNPAGMITTQLIEALQLTMKTGYKHLVVEGEEDLAAVALALLSPLNSHIYYGQPNQGMVEIVVTESLKEQVKQVLSSR